MEWLHILKGARQGERVALDKDTLVLGRSPDCQVVIPVTSVSRQHARLVRAQEKWYLEDMQSRNGTFLNNQPVTTRTPLRHNDRIRICDFVATFHDQPVPPPAPIVPGPPVREEEGSSTTVHSRLNHNSDLFREIQSAEGQPADPNEITSKHSITSCSVVHLEFLGIQHGPENAPLWIVFL